MPRTKKCFKCNKEKSISSFYKHPDMSDGTVNKCKECNKKDVRLNFKKNREYYKKYDKNRIRENFNYIFSHRYSSMKSRVDGRGSRKYNVRGRDMCTKEDFFSWCKKIENLNNFRKLHKKWKQKDFDNIFAPSIDRINNNLGYTIDNIRWITKGENSKKYVF